MEVPASIVRWRSWTRVRETRKANTPWTLEVAAKVLSRLLREPISSGVIRDRAIALGLLRHPDSGRLTFSLRSISRLFLIGYRQPIQAEIGSFDSLRRHADSGRLVFLTMNATHPLTGESIQKVFRVGTVEEEFLTVACLGHPRSKRGLLFRSGFESAWSAAGNGMIVGVQHWDDMPGEGRTFFGSLREPDGAYHWNSAECDTDRQGNLLRF
jgi:hypothetical protein